MNPLPPNRRSTRLHGYNYVGPGTYFVTICTAGRWHFFGEIVENAMRLSDWGEIASREWATSLERRPYIVPHAFVVMPNHVHGLVSFDPVTFPTADLDNLSLGMLSQSLGRFINGYKGSVTATIRSLIDAPRFEVWQRNYHDRVVRDQQEFDTVHEYIVDNPARWARDRFNIQM